MAGITFGPPGIQNEFEEGRPCAELYGQCCAARERTARRTGLSFEDRDLLLMVTTLEEIAEHLALAMYDYGATFGAKPA